MSFESQYQKLIYLRTYSRWDYDKSRREEWEETIDRYFAFMESRVPAYHVNKFRALKDFVVDRRVMPSMRALWSAGGALEADEIAGYNCAGTVIDSPKRFAEIMYILMCGCGVGFSVERQFIVKLPEVPEIVANSKVIKFKDSKLGWVEGFNEIIKGLYKGQLYDYNLDAIRPEGDILKTFGGRASGPGPLKQLLEFTIHLFMEAQGRRLTSLECYDLCCQIGGAIVVGGVRRSALMSLSNLSDQRMRHAKDGEGLHLNPQRYISNNSVVYTEKPDMKIFMEEWTYLMSSGTGERGIFNREIKFKRAREGEDWICNPCSEIILRPNQFCNLTEVVVRPTDTLRSLCEKVKVATILGLVQSTFTDFKFLSKEWKENCEDERLLGVSLTGTCDHPILGVSSDRLDDWLTTMRETSVEVAKVWSKRLKINMPAAITCVKPSGTVSQLVNSSSGIHPRHSHYYYRRVRISRFDPLCSLLIDEGVPHDPEVGSNMDNCNTVVFRFPLKTPKNSVFREDRTALEQLEYWKIYQTAWCEHKPSITVYIKEDEWLEVGAWVYKNWEDVSGISFLPYDGGIYQLPPYEEITKEEYDEAKRTFPEIQYEKLRNYEEEDYTEGARELACSGGNCEI